MHPSRLLMVLWLCLHITSALNILVNNDDGFGSANVRELYRLLKQKGHSVYLIAPVDNKSGQGGLSVFTDLATLTRPSQYDIIPAGAPSFGTDPHDSHIWYYNGTPAACTFFALDYVVPRYTGWSKIDLLVAGPNFGNNLGSFLYTLSGTTGAAYSAIERGIPAIAFSAGNAIQRSYPEINASTAPGAVDAATITAQLAVKLIQQLAARGGKRRLLPYGYGLNVNFPVISTGINHSCTNPPFIQTRLTRGSEIAKAVYNDRTKTFTFGTTQSLGSTTCINGNCSLPGETDVVHAGCFSSVSVFTVDYDAPSCSGSQSVRPLLQPLVLYDNPIKRAGKGYS